MIYNIHNFQGVALVTKRTLNSYHKRLSVLAIHLIKHSTLFVVLTNGLEVKIGFFAVLKHSKQNLLIKF